MFSAFSSQSAVLRIKGIVSGVTCVLFLCCGTPTVSSAIVAAAANDAST